MPFSLATTYNRAVPSGDLISNDVLELLSERIESHEQLEVLLWLVANREQAWTADALSAALNISPDLVANALRALHNHQLALPTGAAGSETRYLPATSALREAVERLVRACSERRFEILRLLSTNAIDRMRRRAIDAFADAFVLGRDKKDG